METKEELKPEVKVKILNNEEIRDKLGISDKKQLTYEEFLHHNHCRRCLKAMPICEETRGFICLLCQEDDRKRDESGPRMI